MSMVQEQALGQVHEEAHHRRHDGQQGLRLFKKFLEKELGEKMLNKTIVRWMSLKIVNGVWETIDIFVDRFDITDF